MPQAAVARRGGAHEEMLARGETYATWFGMQASAY